MAELILSEEELELPFADLDDAALGKAVKAAAYIFCEGDDGVSFDRVLAMRSAACILATFTDEVNSEETNIIVEGLRDSTTGRERGTWVINVKKDWAAEASSNKKFAITGDETSIETNSKAEALDKINKSDKITSVEIILED